MKINRFVLGFLFLAALLSRSMGQDPASQGWARTYGSQGIDESAHAIFPTSDGGYVLGGGRTVDIYQPWLFKVAANGSIVWQNAYGVVGVNQGLESYDQTADGGFIGAGHTYQGTGPADTWIVKFSAQGAIVWQNAYDAGKHDWATSIRRTTDGHYIVLGESYSGNVSIGGYDIYVMKLNTNGGIVWSKVYGKTKEDARSGTIIQTADDGYLVAASMTSADSTGFSSRDVWLMKLDATGQVSWQKRYGQDYDQIPTDVRQTADGGYVISASWQTVTQNGNTSTTNTGLWVFKVDNGGTIVWQKLIEAAPDCVGHTIRQTSDGGYVVVGSFSTPQLGNPSNAWVVKLAGNGTLQWERAYGGTKGDSFQTVLQAANDSFLVAGASLSYGSSPGTADAWFLKLKSDGTVPGGSAITQTVSSTVKDTNVTPANPGATSLTLPFSVNTTNAVTSTTNATMAQQAP